MDAENPLGFKNDFRYQSKVVSNSPNTCCEYAKFINIKIPENGCAPNLHLHFLALAQSFALTVFFAHFSVLCFIIGHLLQHKLPNQWANKLITVLLLVLHLLIWIVIILWNLVLFNYGVFCTCWLNIGVVAFRGCALEWWCCWSVNSRVHAY